MCVAFVSERLLEMGGEDVILAGSGLIMSTSFKRRGGSGSNVKKKTTSSLHGDDDVSSSSSIGVAATTAAASDKHFTQQVALLLPGTRPYTNGLVITSFGLREFDTLLLSSSSSSSGGGGGGQALQTVILIEEDRITDYINRSLCRYWCGEGVSQYQYVLCIALSKQPAMTTTVGKEDKCDEDDDDEEAIVEEEEMEDGSTVDELQNFLLSLPHNLHYEKYCSSSSSSSTTTTASTNHQKRGGDNGNDHVVHDNDDGSNENNNIGHGREMIPSIIEEEEDDDDDDDDAIVEKTTTKNDDEGLVNAWQYRKSIQNARRGMSTSMVTKSTVGGTSTGGSTPTSDFNIQTTTSKGSGGKKDSGSGITRHSSAIYCHSYDLSKRMVDQFVIPSSSSSSSSNSHTINNSNDGTYDDKNNNTERPINPIISHTKIVDCSSTSSSAKNISRLSLQQRGMILFRSIYINIQQAIQTHPSTVIRLFLHRLPINVGSIALPLLLTKIRKENLPIIILGTVRPWRFLSPIITTRTNNTTDPPINKLDTLLSLRQSSDLCISLDSFDSLRIPPPPELSALYTGILTVRKCASHTSTVHYTDSVIPSKRPLADRFGVKRDRRKLTLQLLHLPPEDYGKSTIKEIMGDGVGSGRDNDRNDFGSRSKIVGHAGGCSSLGGSSSSLEF